MVLFCAGSLFCEMCFTKFGICGDFSMEVILVFHMFWFTTSSAICISQGMLLMLSGSVMYLWLCNSMNDSLYMSSFSCSVLGAYILSCAGPSQDLFNFRRLRNLRPSIQFVHVHITLHTKMTWAINSEKMVQYLKSGESLPSSRQPWGEATGGAGGSLREWSRLGRRRFF